MFLGYSPNIRAYKVYKERSKIVMELENVVMDYQRTISTVPRPKECDIERTLHTLRDNASKDYATLRKVPTMTEKMPHHLLNHSPNL